MEKACKFKHRSTFVCPLFGTPRDLPGDQLPTFEDIMRCCNFERQNLAPLEGSKEPDFSKIALIVAKKSSDCYEKASIPSLSFNRILTLIKNYHKACNNIKKSLPKVSTSSGVAESVTDFKLRAKSLFDFAACKCPELDTCLCEKSKRVPPRERDFLVDQKTDRKLFIGGIDKKVTTTLQNRLERKSKELARVESVQLKESDVVAFESCDTEKADGVSSQCDNVNEPVASASSGIGKEDLAGPSSSRNFIPLSNTAAMCDRYGIPDRSAAALINAALQDYGILSEENPSLVVDRHKLRRARQRVRETLQKDGDEGDQPALALYFDGRKDKTFCQFKDGNKYHTRIVTEEHISIVKEPESTYWGHVTPDSGKAKSISKSLKDFLREKKDATDEIQGIGCDGTPVNTGEKGGVIREMENELGRPLQWLVCLLHFNELPFRHLFAHLDGPTSGPTSYTGPIGKALSNCENLPVVAFEPIDCDIPDISSVDVSCDQQYLHEMAMSVKTGNCSRDLSLKKPGPLSNARWLCTASRMLRLYVATNSPSPALIALVTFILKVYLPSWLRIKQNPSCTEGTRHVWAVIRDSRYLPDDMRKVVDKVICNNAYFCHPENMILSMLADDRKHVRELAYRRIIKCRQASQNRRGRVRVFQVPKINLHATDYIDVIDWATVNVTEPPLLAHLPTEELQCIVSESLGDKYLFSRLPCHTQAVERTVKLVTEAASKVCGQEKRDGFILTTLQSRRKMPSFETKKDFKF